MNLRSQSVILTYKSGKYVMPSAAIRRGQGTRLLYLSLEFTSNRKANRASDILTICLTLALTSLIKQHCCGATWLMIRQYVTSAAHLPQYHQSVDLSCIGNYCTTVGLQQKCNTTVAESQVSSAVRDKGSLTVVQNVPSAVVVI
jgi:hypothetical protein